MMDESMKAPDFFAQTWQIARKEVKEHTRSRRFLLFLVLFGAAYLITTILMSSDILNLNQVYWLLAKRYI
jgi:ABC-type transport system involved in multi-copper enzyme maturation permease subunit